MNSLYEWIILWITNILKLEAIFPSTLDLKWRKYIHDKLSMKKTLKQKKLKVKINWKNIKIYCLFICFVLTHNLFNTCLWFTWHCQVYKVGVFLPCFVTIEMCICERERERKINKERETIFFSTHCLLNGILIIIGGGWWVK